MAEVPFQGFEIALAFAPRSARFGLQALWSLDATLGSFVANARDPTLAQMRLSWWHGTLTSLGSGPFGHPVVDALTPLFAHHDARRALLAMMVEGWEELLEPLPLAAEKLERYAVARGEPLFALSAQLLNARALSGAGRGWALADFGRRCSHPGTADRAFAMAREGFAALALKSLPRPLRIIARFAQNDALAGRAVARRGWPLLRAVY